MIAGKRKKMLIILLFISKSFANEQGEEERAEPLSLTGFSIEWKGKSDDIYIYLGSADGFFHCINILTGEILWSIDTGGCVFGSTETDRTTFMPTIDGYLYTFVDDYGYKRAPMSFRDLVFLSPYRTENGEIYTSSKSTSIFFINERGKVTSAYRSNSSTPLKGTFKYENSKGLIIVRVDYLLNVFDNSSKIVQFCEFEIFTGSSTKSSANSLSKNTENTKNSENSENTRDEGNTKNKDNNKDNLSENDENLKENIDSKSDEENIHSDENMAKYEINISTTLMGNVIIFVNGTKTAQIRIRGTPISIYSSFGKFEFELYYSDRPMEHESVAFIIIEGFNVAIPSKPFSAPSSSSSSSFIENDDCNEDLSSKTNSEEDQPIYGMMYDKFVKDNINNENFAIGVYYKQFPYLLFRPLNPNVDLNLPRDKIDSSSFVIVQPFIFHYTFISVMFFVTFLCLRILDMYSLSRINSSLSIQIEIDENDPNFGFFNDTKCSILRTSTIEESVIKGISEINLPSVVKIRAIQPMKEQSLILAVQPLVPYNFHEMNITFFLRNMMNAISILFNNGYVHGSISKDCIFADIDGQPLLGGFEKSCKKSDRIEDQANDVQSIAKMINDFLGTVLEPILFDLLTEMQFDNINERPTPSEVLKHPLFLSPVARLNVIDHANDFLQTRESRVRGVLQRFDERSPDIVGDDWTKALDEVLIRDAKNYSEYAGSLTSDLIRFIRNKWQHSVIMPNGHKLTAEEYFQYFHRKFPNLFLYTFYFLDCFDIM